MTAHDTQFLPKEPLDLPREPLDLPPPEPNSNQAQYQIQTLLEWEAPGRPFRKRRKEFYLNSLLIALFIEIILFLFAQYVLMLVVASLVFVTFALVTVPPHNFKYRISTEGITIEDHFFLWQELYDFYFKKRDGANVLHITTRALLPPEITITIGNVSENKIKNILLSYLPYREVIKPTLVEKSATWLSKTFPLERTV